MSNVLALRNLVHDRIRLIVTLVGIAFSVVLINSELGLLLGFTQTTASLIDRAHADLWIMGVGTRDVDQAGAIPDRRLYQALAVPGVAEAAPLNVDFAYLKRPDGGTESVILVGFDPSKAMGGPWNVVAGNSRSVRFPETIIIDDLYRQKLGVRRLGDVVEINGHRARVIGFTHGIRSFSQSPYVFTSEDSAREYSHIRPDQTKYILVRLNAAADPAAVARALQRAIPDVAVKTTSEFRHLTQFYWIFTTGAGMAVLLAALLGLVVGVVIVSQTLYATTIDHLGEFATLRAIGGSNRFIYNVIIRQAAMSAVVGYAIGLALSLGILRATENAAAALDLPGWMMAAMLALTLAMCVAAAVLSIRKVTELDPAAVFK